jgi:type III secretion system YscQ/HrcQ family protein
MSETLSRGGVLTADALTKRRIEPMGALPAISREEIDLTRRVRMTLTSLGLTADRLRTTFSDLCGEAVSVSLRRATRRDLASVSEHSVGVLVGTSEDDSTSPVGGKVLVDVEAALATALVARALRQRAPRIVATTRVSADTAGAFAAVLHAALRRAYTGGPLRIVAVGPVSTLMRDFLAPSEDFVTAWTTVSVDGSAYDARVSVASARLASGAAPPLGREGLSAMGEVTLAVPLVAATCLVTRAELRSLRRGDAIVFAAPELRHDEQGLYGGVVLVCGSSQRGLSGVLSEGGVLRTVGLETQSWEPNEDRMPSADENKSGASTDDTLEMLDDAPVVVRVELGVVEMKAHEWAALVPGDVLSLGRKLGDPASLRVGGVELARGELVQIDGEYGVRILARGSR